jgi:hypothetical protein
VAAISAFTRVFDALWRGPRRRQAEANGNRQAD